MPSSMLKHKGVVEGVDDSGVATVLIARGSACAACGEKSSCTIADNTDIRLRFKNSAHLKKGAVVEIGIEKKSFYKSLTTIYIVPLFLMLAVAIVADKLTGNQLITAFSTLAGLAVYFIFLKFKHKGQDKQSYRLIG